MIKQAVGTLGPYGISYFLKPDIKPKKKGFGMFNRKLKKRISELEAKIVKLESGTDFDRSAIRDLTKKYYDLNDKFIVLDTTLKKIQDVTKKFDSAVCSHCGKTDFVSNMERKEEAVLTHECTRIHPFCFAEVDTCRGCAYDKITGSKIKTTYKHKSCRKPANIK